MRERSLTGPDYVAPDTWSVAIVLGAWARVDDAEALVERIGSLYDRLLAGDLGTRPDSVTSVRPAT